MPIHNQVPAVTPVMLPGEFTGTVENVYSQGGDGHLSRVTDTVTQQLSANVDPVGPASDFVDRLPAFDFQIPATALRPRRDCRQ